MYMILYSKLVVWNVVCYCIYILCAQCALLILYDCNFFVIIITKLVFDKSYLKTKQNKKDYLAKTNRVHWPFLNIIDW